MPNATTARYLDLAGRVFGRLTALRTVRVNGERLWECRCECGAVKAIYRSNLTSGTTKSCGCLQRELNQARGKASHRAALAPRQSAAAPAYSNGTPVRTPETPLDQQARRARLKAKALSLRPVPLGPLRPDPNWKRQKGGPSLSPLARRDCLALVWFVLSGSQPGVRTLMRFRAAPDLLGCEEMDAKVGRFFISGWDHEIWEELRRDAERLEL